VVGEVIGVVIEVDGDGPMAAGDGMDVDGKLPISWIPPSGPGLRPMPSMKAIRMVIMPRHIITPNITMRPAIVIPPLADHRTDSTVPPLPCTMS
jgi:hypothetical protein